MRRATIIEDCIVRVDGTDELVGIATVTLPDIENKSETVTGFGMMEHEEIVPTAFNAMTLSLKYVNRSKNIKFKSNNQNLTITAGILIENSETHEYEREKLIVSVKGKKKKTSGGELGKATKNETEVELALTYYKEEIGGEVIHEIDVYNKKAIIDGEDLYAELNNLLS